jgi:two-component system, chemotaxis family, CheB/CheR fusion protein
MPDQGDDNLSESPERKANTFVVGIGASAGGISALREFFNRVSKDSGMAYVVILHLSPQHESTLPELLQNCTILPVTQVTEPVKVQPNHVYVISPQKYLMMSDGMIRPTEPERTHGHPTSIDLFFRTLADAYGKDAVAIVLSGVGADGTIGLGRIKEQGGFAIVQDPAEAEYDNMPRSAIDAGLVDLVMPVAEMPAKLVALRETARRLQISGEREEEIPQDLDEAALRGITTLLRLRTGNDFSQYRRPTLLRRIARRMQVRELHELNLYLTFLRDNPEEVSALLRDLLITVTNFFRDSDAFEMIQKEVVPQMFAGRNPDDQVRVWCAGCATGEEAYSIAILLAEHAAKLAEPPKVQVFATDIDERAIAQGREGRYPDTISVDISAERLRQFFIKEANYYRIKKPIREMVLFAPHNLLRDPPFSRLDLVSCRNLLIYLNRDMQERVLEILHFAIRHDGFLFLGSSETAENVPSLFLPLDKKNRIYRRRDFLGLMPPTPYLTGGKREAKPTANERRPHEQPASAGELHYEAVELLAPPSVLVNEEFEILHSSAQAGRYLHIAGGEPTRNLLKLVNADLQLDLRAALFEAQARADAHAAVTRRVRIKQNGETRWMNLSVRQITAFPRAAQGFFLVLFDETTEPVQPELAATDDEAAKIALVRDLEQQLQQAKDQLRITVEQHETSTEELRASNEELQAINEELRSATEELETSKEELQSVNEELSTVNQEYKEKIEEVGRANSDLQNLMASIDIATIFLDRSFQIKRYTPRAQALFNVTPNDIGRPLEHFTNKLEYGALHEDAERVLTRLETIEHEIRGVDGLWYLARLTPYRTTEDKIDGVVLTFIDITNRKQFEDQLLRQTIELREQAEILNLSSVMVLGEEDRIMMWNSGCERLYGYTSAEAVGKIASELLRTEFSTPYAEIIAQLRRTGQWQGELVHTTRTGEKIQVASQWILHRREPDRPAVILEINNDITARRKAEDALVEADQNKDRFLLTLGHELRNPLGAMLSSVTLLRMNASPEVSTRARDIIERQLNILVRLVDDLLDMERLTRGRITLKKEPVEVSAVINAALETSKPLIDSQGHQLELAMPKERIIVDGDLARLGQVVSNLLHNACKYSPPKSRIDVKVEREGGDTLIRVRDSGVGVAPEMIPKLFDMFAQAPPTAGAQLQGFGVGLALVRQLVELHGGSVTAHSEGVGKGTEFVVRLPISSRSATGRRATAAAVDPAKSPKRKVLIVEDNNDSGAAMAALLRSGGHEARVASDGVTALAIAAQFKPDAAIVDIGLPDIDGYEVAARIREVVPTIVLFALSGWPADPNERRSREAGFKQYFVKPLEHEELNRILAEI